MHSNGREPGCEWWNQHHSGINAIISCWKHEKVGDENSEMSEMAHLTILRIICFHAFMRAFNADRLNPMQVQQYDNPAPYRIYSSFIILFIIVIICVHWIIITV